MTDTENSPESRAIPGVVPPSPDGLVLGRTAKDCSVQRGWTKRCTHTRFNCLHLIARKARKYRTHVCFTSALRTRFRATHTKHWPSGSQTCAVRCSQAAEEPLPVRQARPGDLILRLPCVACCGCCHELVRSRCCTESLLGHESIPGQFMVQNLGKVYRLCRVRPFLHVDRPGLQANRRPCTPHVCFGRGTCTTHNADSETYVSALAATGNGVWRRNNEI